VFGINEDFKKIISDCGGVPGVEKIVPIHTGRTNLVIDANCNGENFIFRFPLHQMGADELVKEVEICAAIAGRVSVAVPNQVLLRDGVGRVFSRHKKILGRTLADISAGEGAGGEDVGAIALGVVEFVNELGALSASDMPRHCGVHVSERYYAMARACSCELSPEIIGSIRRAEEKDSVLIHGDLNADNVIADAGGVLGVIDFMPVCMGARQFALARLCGRLPARYRAPVIKAARAKGIPADDAEIDGFIKILSFIDAEYERFTNALTGGRGACTRPEANRKVRRFVI
jgi:aminoglycoside phosphotransferase (APT) family kinase protein